MRIALIIISVVFILLYLEFFDFWIYLLFLVLLLIVYLCSIYFLKGYRNFHSNFHIIPLQLLAVIFLTSLSANIILNFQKSLSKIRARIIVEQIENYKSVNGRYPKKMQEVISLEFSEIPPTLLGVFKDKKYFYKSFGDEYILWFDWQFLDPGGAYVYFSESKSWRFDD